ncbi:MAG TPA: hypothetical protein VNJ02_01715 [Vicinamibacterales bacterium]|nr:hypothetical protein [Vicinamibacterales bacterium]
MGTYYYAAGEKVEIDTDGDHVAVDEKVARLAGLDPEVRLAVGSELRQGAGVLLARRSALGKGTLAKLEKAGALQPVYKRERSVMAAMPEVRVEFDDARQRRAVLDVLADGQAIEHVIVEDRADRMIIRPSSGQGGDALELANAIYERARPASSSVRFIQFVPKLTVAP